MPLARNELYLAIIQEGTIWATFSPPFLNTHTPYFIVFPVTYVQQTWRRTWLRNVQFQRDDEFIRPIILTFQTKKNWSVWSYIQSPFYRWFLTFFIYFSLFAQLWVLTRAKNWVGHLSQLLFVGHFAYRLNFPLVRALELLHWKLGVRGSHQIKGAK